MTTTLETHPRRECGICGDDSCAVTYACQHCKDTLSDVALTLAADGTLWPFHPKGHAAPIACKCGLLHWAVAPGEEQLTVCNACAETFDKEISHE